MRAYRFVNFLALRRTIFHVSGWGAAINKSDLISALCFAASTAAVTLATEPLTIIVTSLPPSFFSQVMKVTAAALSIVSRTFMALHRLGSSTNPNADLSKLNSCLLRRRFYL